MTALAIPGYTYGQAGVEVSAIDQQAFKQLQQTVLFTDEDVRYLRLAGTVLEPHIEEILDVWYGFVGSHPHLLAYFSTADGDAIPDYLQRVRARFAQWIRDTTQRPYDQNWLNYQAEIALRHHRTKKNVTDGLESVEWIPVRYIIAFIYPLTATIRPFLARQGHNSEDIDRMFHAWFKSIVLQATLWAYPYVNPGEF